MSRKRIRPLVLAGGLPVVLPDRPEGVGADLVSGVDVWGGQRFSGAGVAYERAWATLAEALYKAGVDPSYAWGGAEVGYLVTAENQASFAQIEVARYRAAVRRQILAPGDETFEALVQSIPGVLRRAVATVIDGGGSGDVRGIVDALFDEATGLDADVEQLGVVSARILETLFSWLDGLARLGANREQVLAWVRDRLGPGTAQDVGLLLQLIDKPGVVFDRREVSAELGERYLPGLGCLVAATLAVHHDGDADVLTGLDPAW